MIASTISFFPSQICLTVSHSSIDPLPSRTPSPPSHSSPHPLSCLHYFLSKGLLFLLTDSLISRLLSCTLYLTLSTSLQWSLSPPFPILTTFKLRDDRVIVCRHECRVTCTDHHLLSTSSTAPLRSLKHSHSQSPPPPPPPHKRLYHQDKDKNYDSDAFYQ